MPFVIVIIGVMVLLSAINGSYQAFGNQIATDLTGKNTGTGSAPVGYIYWVSSIVAIGLVGYYSPLQKFSRTFMLLILVGMILSNKGLFQQLSDALKNGPLKQTGSTSASATPATQTASNTAAPGTLAGGASNIASSETSLTAAETVFA